MSDNAKVSSVSSISLANDSVLDAGVVASRGGQETVTDFETADLSYAVDRTIEMPPRQIDPTENRTSSKPTSNSESGFPSDQSEDFAISRLSGTYQGIPSWLTSLIFHLTVILILALVSVSDGGKKIVELLATAKETVEVEPYVTFDVALDPVKVEALSDEVEMPVSKLMETTDLAPVLDDALLSASLESEDQNSLFERISSEGVAESDLPRRVAGGGAKFFGVDGQGSDFVFIVDCSGSMADYGRWRQAVRELKKSVGGLTTNQRFLILLYNDGFIAMNDDTRLVKSTKREQKKAFKWLTANAPNSWTFCAQALEKALTLRPDAIFLLSDGEFNDRQDVFFVLDSMNNKSKLRQYKRQQIPVHTIALGSHQGRFTMKRIADENNGLFRMVE